MIRINLLLFLAMVSILFASPLASGNAFADNTHTIDDNRGHWHTLDAFCSHLDDRNGFQALVCTAIADLETQIHNISLTPGPAGPQGATGPAGPQGATGPAGSSASAYCPPLSALTYDRTTKLAFSNLSGCDYHGADLHSLNFAGANLAGANLAGANLEGTNFIGANLSGANLSSVFIHGAIFIDANLSYSNLSNILTSNANLQGANISGANATGLEDNPMSPINAAHANPPCFGNFICADVPLS